MLKEDQPAVLPEFLIDNSLMMEYALTTALPPDIVSRFIVQRNAEIANDGKEVWRHGVVLKAKQALALVIEDDRSIKIYVSGIGKTDYISELRDTLNGIFDTYRNKKPELKYRVIMHGTEEGYSVSPVDSLPALSHEAIIAHVEANRDYFDVDSRKSISLDRTVNYYNIVLAIGDGNQVVAGKDIKIGSLKTSVNKPTTA
jgi:hypothetical protein